MNNASRSYIALDDVGDTVAGPAEADSPDDFVADECGELEPGEYTIYAIKSVGALTVGHTEFVPDEEDEE